MCDAMPVRDDQMKLYLLKKNLNAITKVNLAGIKPYWTKEIRLGSGKDYRDREKRIYMPLRGYGAYLVVLKGKERDASGMVLRTDMKIEVQEDRGSGRVRVNVYDRRRGKYVHKAFVRVVGSDDGKFRSGYTDLRGVYVGDDVKGKATVIVAHKEQYAFHRGEKKLRKSYSYRRRPKPKSQKQLLLDDVMNQQEKIQRRSRSWFRSNIMFNPKNREMSVIDIAFTAGFNSKSTFNRFFKNPQPVSD